MIYFTADTHFNHTNIIKYCDRPFLTVAEMNKALIKNWNQTVKTNDIVYHLGDFGFFRSVSDMWNIYKQLNGKKKIILGSHDNPKSILRIFGKENVYTGYHVLKINKQYITLCHYPMCSWPRSFYNSYHFFGHCHSLFQHNNVRAIDVGVDCFDYKPVSLNYLLREDK
jgi:calcineurin-like phosphoesterase family protein